MKNQQFKQSKHEPFIIVKINNKYSIAAGQNIVSRKTFDTIKQAEEYIATKPYELILNTALCMFVEIQKQNEKDNKESKQDVEAK